MHVRHPLHSRLVHVSRRSPPVLTVDTGAEYPRWCAYRFQRRLHEKRMSCASQHESVCSRESRKKTNQAMFPLRASIACVAG